jgi:beta-aspartyl-peptidase (threonine type)
MGRLIAFIARVRATSDPQAIGLGIDQASALCVDASGKGRLFTNGGGFAWLVQPRSRPMLRPGVPLDYSSIGVTAIGPASVVDLKTLRVDAAAFRREISVTGGVLANFKSLPEGMS